MLVVCENLYNLVVKNNASMKTITFSQCASMFAVDEFFINHVCNILNITSPNISIDDLGVILEEVLLYKEQYSFLGEFAKHSDVDKCFCFELTNHTTEKRGNAWRVKAVTINTIHPHIRRQDFIQINVEGIGKLTKCKLFRHEWFCTDYSYQREIYSNDETIYANYILIPVRSILTTPPVFNPIIRDDNLYYLDYGKPSAVEIIQSRKYYDVAKQANKGFCILDKEGYRLTRYYKHLQTSDDGSIWAANGHDSWEKHYAYYTPNIQIKTTHRFDFYGTFSEGLCPIGYDYGGKKIWGFINIEGETVISVHYKKVDLEQGFYWGICKVGQQHGEGYINKNGLAVTSTGKLIISEKDETFRFAKHVGNKYITENGRVFSEQAEDLGMTLDKNSIYDRFSFYKVTSYDGLVGYLNNQYEIVIPLIYAEISYFWSGVAKAITPDGKIVFLNTENQIQNITLEDFENIKISTRKALEEKAASIRSFNQNRIYRIHFIDWNGMKKIYQTRARSRDEAIDDFWHSGVKFGAFIESVD